MNWRRPLIDAVLRSVGGSRADLLIRPLLAGSGVIFTFHRVLPRGTDAGFHPNRFLEVTPEFLATVVDLTRAAGFEIISMDAVLNRLRNPTAKKFAVLTFDDGFRDTFDIAADVLKRRSAPWTAYVVPSFLEGTGRLWWLELETCVRQLDAVKIAQGDSCLHLRTRTTKEKHSAYALLASIFYKSPAMRRFDLVDDLCRQANVPTGTLTSQLCASWAELKLALDCQDLTVGAHTKTHPVLSRCSDTDSTQEITDSKDIIEKKLGCRLRHLSYPHGSSWAYGPREIETARRAGYETAVSTSMSHLNASSSRDPFALPRISMDGCRQSSAAVHAVLSGITSLGPRLRSRAIAHDVRRLTGGGSVQRM